MSRTTKTYKLNRDYSIDCVTTINFFGEKKYSIYVLLECVPWREEVESVEGLTDSNEANTVFLELKAKYKDSSIYDALIR